jgi:uncharacterized protein (DUF58 family)
VKWFRSRRIKRKRRPPTRITKSGWAIVLASFLTGSAAFNSANNVLFVALALQLSVVLINGLLSWWNFSRIGVNRFHVSSCRARETGAIQLVFEDRKRIFPSLGLSAVFEVRAPDGSVETLEFPVLTGRGLGSGIPQEYSWNPKTRGRYRMSFKHLESSFPFGFIVKTYPFPMEQEVIVWPGRRKVSSSSEAGASVMGVELRAQRKEGWEEIHGLRDYRRGDPMASIHWKKSTRSGAMVVKLRGDALSRGAAVVFDTHLPDQSPRGLWEDYLECIADWSLALHNGGYELQLSLHGAPFYGVPTGKFPSSWFDALALALPAAEPLAIAATSGRTSVAVIAWKDFMFESSRTMEEVS